MFVRTVLPIVLLLFVGRGSNNKHGAGMGATTLIRRCTWHEKHGHEEGNSERPVRSVSRPSTGMASHAAAGDTVAAGSTLNG
jgi:hypothetical protein